MASLKVKHIIVLGHYGCGGVAAAMMPQDAIIRAADVAVQSWISPIRHIYETSSRYIFPFISLHLIYIRRKEITLFREKSKRQPLTTLPDLHDRVFIFSLLLFHPLTYIFSFSCIPRSCRRKCEIQCSKY